MNSRMYDCTVMHHRLEPLKNRFTYSLFMFYLDLDELDLLSGTLRLFSRNRWNLFAFHDRDHLTLHGMTVRENILEYLRLQGIHLGNGRIFLLTHLRTLGHVFNPVSFYFCFDESGSPVCAVPEVGNTFGEMKPFVLAGDALAGRTFRARMTKHFYVSPFADLDSAFDFQLRVPEEKLHIGIDGYQRERRFLITSLSGKKTPLTDAGMMRSFLKVPFVTLKVIGLIHFQAARLFVRGLRYHGKSDHPELQKEVFAWKR